MSEQYQGHGFVVTDETVTAPDAVTKRTRDLLQAEAYRLQPVGRNLLLFVVGCLGPIASMVILTQVGAIEALRFWFGPAVLLCAVVCGAAACLIGLRWPRPWGVVVEEGHNRFEPLARTPSREAAEEVAQAINAAIARQREPTAA